MRRIRFVVASLLVVLLGVAALAASPLARAQNATPAAGGMAGHPLVGSWIINDPTGSPSITAFTADGIVVDTETQGGVGIGSWAITGDNTAAFTFAIPLAGGAQQGLIVIRGTLTVDAAGKTLSGPYSFTVTSNTGAVLASGNGQVTGTRLPVEPIAAGGTPLAGFPTWTPQQQGAPPAATPAA
jgi:hypothetical protein